MVMPTSDLIKVLKGKSRGDKVELPPLIPAFGGNIEAEIVAIKTHLDTVTREEKKEYVLSVRWHGVFINKLSVMSGKNGGSVLESKHG